MNDGIFLEQVHSTIRSRKLKRNGIISFLSVMLMVVVSYNSMLTINNEKLQMQWDMQQIAEQEIYQWEEYPALSEQDKLEYLIDEMDIYDFFAEFQDDIIKQIKMDGV